ncbi:hypothetical protein L228DRAFT_65566 [Xylona heveae TC161]|uniref:BTB domain-containing protein n=1 Tax=Xylona heveae (strain CBS 132557 / TC161) TaxID=1328760 RepID=A0A165IR45_XYLHT|nr:hypothetical protein L228DRAFT_65566 [Xylona heveae TC161]KZF25263.1 hypothetical protein L228DRAFT_65566 [Xylona heveae TC161]
MVSHSESSERTLTLRRPPSISSRASSTRRHRTSRSHHGSSSYQPQNEFPIFTHSGDVEILISVGAQEQRYLLHRLILAQSSGFFEAGTSEEWSRAQANGASQAQGLAVIGETPSAGQGVTRPGPSSHSRDAQRPRWRYELDGGNRPDEIPMLVQKNPSTSIFGGVHTPRPPPVRNKPPAPQAGFFRSMANFSSIQIPTSRPPDDPADDLLRDYDNMLRIFYNYSPTLDNVNIANAYVECKSLLALADMYDALEVVGPRIDHHLLQFQGRLWKQIAKYPPSYLKLGYLARSRIIFAEALIHVVGQWPSGANQLRNHLPGSMLDLIEDKVEDLEDLKCKIEGRLFRLTLTTAKGERVTPTNSYIDWLAVSLFRQWLAENTSSALPPPPPPPPRSIVRASQTGSAADSYQATSLPRAPPSALPINTGRIYRLLGVGGSAYLGHDELKRFLKLRPEDYTRDSLRRFERRMDELKSMAREIVRPLMRNYLQLDLGKDGSGSGSGGSLGYLTCTRVEEQDFLWEAD